MQSGPLRRRVDSKNRRAAEQGRRKPARPHAEPLRRERCGNKAQRADPLQCPSRTGDAERAEDGQASGSRAKNVEAVDAVWRVGESAEGEADARRGAEERKRQ